MTSHLPVFLHAKGLLKRRALVMGYAKIMPFISAGMHCPSSLQTLHVFNTLLSTSKACLPPSFLYPLPPTPPAQGHHGSGGGGGLRSRRVQTNCKKLQENSRKLRENCGKIAGKLQCRMQPSLTHPLEPHHSTQSAWTLFRPLLASYQKFFQHLQKWLNHQCLRW